jgi:hypothetical protein
MSYEIKGDKRLLVQLGETCPSCQRRNALSVWTDVPAGAPITESWLACDFCSYDERLD